MGLNWECDTAQKLNMWRNEEKMWQLKNPKSVKTQKLKILQNSNCEKKSNTQNFTTLKPKIWQKKFNLQCDKTPKIEMCQIKKCDKTKKFQFRQNKKMLNVTKL